jgi:hypothetical protein
VDERVNWQAKVIVALSALRAVSLSAAALITRDLSVVLWVLVGFAAFKSALLTLVRAPPLRLRRALHRARSLQGADQAAAPFAVSGGLTGFRSQGDQWIAAMLFTVPQFASFSVAP